MAGTVLRTGEVMMKFIRDGVRLGVFWVAICTSLAGMLIYTKSGLEVLLADFIAEQSTQKPPAGQPRFRTQ